MMKIRDGYATLEGDDTTFTAKSGSIEIVSSDGQTMLEIRQRGLTFDISAASTGKHNGKVFDNRFTIRPGASNLIRLELDDLNITQKGGGNGS